MKATAYNNTMATNQSLMLASQSHSFGSAANYSEQTAITLSKIITPRKSMGRSNNNPVSANKQINNTSNINQNPSMTKLYRQFIYKVFQLSSELLKEDPYQFLWETLDEHRSNGSLLIVLGSIIEQVCQKLIDQNTHQSYSQTLLINNPGQIQLIRLLTTHKAPNMSNYPIIPAIGCLLLISSLCVGIRKAHMSLVNQIVRLVRKLQLQIVFGLHDGKWSQSDTIQEPYLSNYVPSVSDLLTPVIEELSTHYSFEIREIFIKNVCPQLGLEQMQQTLQEKTIFHRQRQSSPILNRDQKQLQLRHLDSQPQFNQNSQQGSKRKNTRRNKQQNINDNIVSKSTKKNNDKVKKIKQAQQLNMFRKGRKSVCLINKDDINVSTQGTIQNHNNHIGNNLTQNNNKRESAHSSIHQPNNQSHQKAQKELSPLSHQATTNDSQLYNLTNVYVNNGEINSNGIEQVIIKYDQQTIANLNSKDLLDNYEQSGYHRANNSDYNVDRIPDSAEALLIETVTKPDKLTLMGYHHYDIYTCPNTNAEQNEGGEITHNNPQTKANNTKKPLRTIFQRHNFKFRRPNSLAGRRSHKLYQTVKNQCQEGQTQNGNRSKRRGQNNMHNRGIIAGKVIQMNIQTNYFSAHKNNPHSKRPKRETQLRGTINNYQITPIDCQYYHRNEQQQSEQAYKQNNNNNHYSDIDSNNNNFDSNKPNCDSSISDNLTVSFVRFNEAFMLASNYSINQSCQMDNISKIISNRNQQPFGCYQHTNNNDSMISQSLMPIINQMFKNGSQGSLDSQGTQASQGTQGSNQQNVVCSNQTSQGNHNYKTPMKYIPRSQSKSKQSYDQPNSQLKSQNTLNQGHLITPSYRPVRSRIRTNQQRIVNLYSAGQLYVKPFPGKYEICRTSPRMYRQRQETEQEQVSTNNILKNIYDPSQYYGPEILQGEINNDTNETENQNKQLREQSGVNKREYQLPLSLAKGKQKITKILKQSQKIQLQNAMQRMSKRRKRGRKINKCF